MTDANIKCPECGHEITLTESIAAPMLAATRAQFERRLAEKDEAVAMQEAAITERAERLTEETKGLEARVAVRVAAEKAKIVEDEREQSRKLLATDLEAKGKTITDLNELLRSQDTKLAEAQKEQAEFLRKSRDLETAKRELELTIEKRVQETSEVVRKQARSEIGEDLRLKLLERDTTIDAMKRQLEELKKRAEQGSQQLQGEAQELDLENRLAARFPQDDLQPVPKGEHGGDLLQRVIGPGGQQCGSILWECKRTKNWSDAWLAKLRSDQRAAKAEVAVIVSNATPRDVETFDLIEGVWVVHPNAAMALATALRLTLTELAASRLSNTGIQTKTAMVYDYLVGPHFRQRVQAIVEAFGSMESDLAREKRAIMKQWAKREEQIARVTLATVGMYGDLQAIAGKSLPEIEGLALPAPDEEDE